MSVRWFGLALTVAVVCGVSADRNLAQQNPTAAAANSPEAFVQQYCLGCHNDSARRGGLTLEAFDVAHPERDAELAERVIRKVRAGMMPPPSARRPAIADLKAFAATLEDAVDRAAASRTEPGIHDFQRLNRTEYARSVRELLDLDVDVSAYLPPDNLSHGFDNIADGQSFSPALMEGYIRAASRISRLAVGDPQAAPSVATYKVARTASQMRHVEGAPIGTRGGIAVVHNFPADGDYVFKMSFFGTPSGILFGQTTKGEQIEVSIDGERVALLDIDPRMREAEGRGLNLETPPVAVTAGPHRVAAAFIQRFEAMVDDLIRPLEQTLADTSIANGPGVTTLPHLQDFGIAGPYGATGVSETPSRRKIFTCRPATPRDEEPCVQEIISTLAQQAYRRPVTPEDLEGLMNFYALGRLRGGFEAGIQTALQAILASPNFVFRLERQARDAMPGELYRIDDLALASRLSYFLWSSSPDEELLAVAAAGRLHEPVELERQVRRMLADDRSEALSTRFAALWLRLQDLKNIHPDSLEYPEYDRTLAEAMQRETELLFDSIVKEDRSILELLTADYTFVNERLARHYGIPNVMGNRFRRVSLADDGRRGVLGHGSILTLTSVADRTSPVMRGKWVMEVLLGTPPPPPPPAVPDLEETRAEDSGRFLSVRERLEEHRRNPACRSCHQLIDPIGLALENFDVTGAWRIKDHGNPIDASGVLFDGSGVDGPQSLRQALLNHSDVYVRAFAENLLTYGLGRGLDYHDMPLVRSIVRQAAGNGNRFSSFVLGIVSSPPFSMRKADGTVQ